MEVQIDGTTVVLRDKLTLKDGYDVYGFIMQCDAQDMRTHVPLMRRMIESWEFEGDPSKAASYDELDMLRVLIPLSNQVHRHVNRQMAPPAPAVNAKGEPEKN